MYRALYRKWRPSRFEDVVGQQAIVTALKNQVAAGRIGHAYLFTGTRGTGKTTCAKIFAKAVNCPHQVDGDPCGACDICRGIDNGSILDVVEIDAASNNGVDNIRDIRDETAYTPSECTYKVYIIDEVHMLSIAAFNALLKIMEEPPSHVIFILATTEIHKVPATILSRCQRYDFSRIQPEDIAARLRYIAGEEQIELTEEAAQLVARLADGALRDALSILDTCAGVSMQVDAELVRRMSGVTDRGYLFELSTSIHACDTADVLAQVALLRQRSVDMKRLCEELINHYRNLMLA
ncbi:MAG: DNA polymerase III subunit gamma/tau, partial [Oscillospiraceae bacterium]|nr:DNA polymerase III subunit gamma/tau [Oscillospiraceae bacterium]